MADDDQDPGTQTPDHPTPTNAGPTAAELAEQLQQAQARNLDLERAALQHANPDLPETAFAGTDLASIQASVAAARTIADHIRDQADKARNGTDPDAAAAAARAAAAGATRTPEPIPHHVRGTARIAAALIRYNGKTEPA